MMKVFNLKQGWAHVVAKRVDDYFTPRCIEFFQKVEAPQKIEQNIWVHLKEVDFSKFDHVQVIRWCS
jgi:hypothetical protein